MAKNFVVPSKIIFGENAANELVPLIEDLAVKKVLLVYDGGVKAAGIADIIIGELKKTSVSIVIFDRVLPNPSDELVDEATELAKKENVEAIIAVGGGSAIDLAKAVNILLTNPAPIHLYEGPDKVKNETKTLIAIPTTAGTSSEITNVIALIDTKKVRKMVIVGKNVGADYAIVDPKFTLTMPKSVTAATGMDAMTHAIESYVSVNASELTEYNALKGLKILYDNIKKVVEDGNDIKAREQMLLGCLITGFSFNNADLGLVHGIAHTLSAHFNLPHGMANAAVLPYVMEYNAEVVPEKMVDLAKALGIETTGNIEEDKLLAAKAMIKLGKEIGIKPLGEQGVKKSSFGQLADDVLVEPVLNFNPRKNVTKQDVLEILEKAF